MLQWHLSVLANCFRQIWCLMLSIHTVGHLNHSMFVGLQLDVLGEIICWHCYCQHKNTNTTHTTMILSIVLENIQWMYALYICLNCSHLFIFWLNKGFVNFSNVYNKSGVLSAMWDVLCQCKIHSVMLYFFLEKMWAPIIYHFFCNLKIRCEIFYHTVSCENAALLVCYKKSSYANAQLIITHLAAISFFPFH